MKRGRGRPPTPRTAKLPPPVKGARWIALTRGQFALVDEADYAWLSELNWFCCRNGYAMRTIYENDTYIKVPMHRLLIDVAAGLEVDHANCNRLDNRRANLRACTLQQNRSNRRRYVNNRSGYKGVSWSKREGRYRATIGCKGRKYYLGGFDDAAIAARHYDAAAVRLFGEFSQLNFPGEYGAKVA